MNWNPKYSPIWRWLGAHGVAILAAVVSHPELFGEHAAQVNNLAGIVTAVGFALGANLKKPE